MKTFLALTFCLFEIFVGSPLAIASDEFLYKQINESEQNFEARKSARPNLKSYDEHAAKRLVPANLKENLNGAFLKAQEEFLKSELTSIESHWRDVAAYALKADWEPTQREMIQIAFMRLAQIAISPEETRKNVIAAFEFDPAYEPSEKLFPPPIVDEYRAVRSRTTRLKVSLQNTGGFTIVSINGVQHRISQRENLELISGSKRVTYISPTYETVTRILDTQDIAKFRPQKNLLPALKSLIGARPALPYHLATDLEKPAIEKPMNEVPKFYEKPKFWLGTALTVGAVLLVNSMGKDEKREPTHREGL